MSKEKSFILPFETLCSVAVFFLFEFYVDGKPNDSDLHHCNTDIMAKCEITECRAHKSTVF